MHGSSHDQRTVYCRANFWKHVVDYFPADLVKTADLDPSHKYIFATHPHGRRTSTPACGDMHDPTSRHARPHQQTCMTTCRARSHTGRPPAARCHAAAHVQGTQPHWVHTCCTLSCCCPHAGHAATQGAHLLHTVTLLPTCRARSHTVKAVLSQRPGQVGAPGRSCAGRAACLHRADGLCADIHPSLLASSTEAEHYWSLAAALDAWVQEKPWERLAAVLHLCHSIQRDVIIMTGILLGGAGEVAVLSSWLWGEHLRVCLQSLAHTIW
jgi:hypothetical protein